MARTQGGRFRPDPPGAGPVGGFPRTEEPAGEEPEVPGLGPGDTVDLDKEREETGSTTCFTRWTAS